MHSKKHSANTFPARLLLFLITISLLFFLRGFRIYTVLSGSMEPALPTGSIVLVDTGGNRKPSVGDILTFRQGAMTVTHRITDVSEDGFVTKGDANPMEDSTPVTRDQIIGTVRLSIPLIGFLISAIRTSYGVALLLLLSIMTILKTILKNKSTDHSENERNTL